MKKSKFSERQIATALRQVDAGVPIPEITRSLGISEDTYLCVAQEVGTDGRGRYPAVAAAG